MSMSLMFAFVMLRVIEFVNLMFAQHKTFAIRRSRWHLVELIYVSRDAWKFDWLRCDEQKQMPSVRNGTYELLGDAIKVITVWCRKSISSENDE